MRKVLKKCAVVLVILLLLAATVSCTIESSEETDTTTVTPTVIISATQKKGGAATPNETPTTKSQPFTKTPATTSQPSTNTPTIATKTATYTQQPIYSLGFCHATENDICIGSLLQRSTNLDMVMLMPTNQENVYILFDQVRYDCVAIVNFSDRYLCPGLPQHFNKFVKIQVFFSDTQIPIASGNVLIAPPSSSNVTKTPKPTPKDVYSPY